MGVGTITLHNNDTANFNVYSIKELQVIIDHCVKYPLITQKHSDFLLFKQAFEIIQRGDHLTEKGLLEIVGLKSALNLGLSEKLRAAFLNFVSITRPAFKFNGIPDPFWVAGFISGDGSFYLKIKKSEKDIGCLRSVSLIYSFHLHIRELEVLKGLCDYFNNYFNQDILSYEKVHTSEENNSVHFKIEKFTDISEKIIPGRCPGARRP